MTTAGDLIRKLRETEASRPVAMGDIDIVDHLSALDVTRHLFYRQMLRKSFGHVHETSWPTQVTAIPDSLQQAIQCAYSSDAVHSALLHGRDYLAWLRLADGQASVGIAAPGDESATEALALLRETVPPSVLDADEKRVPLWLWTWTSNGPRKIRRIIDVPAWSDIRGNYTHTVREELEATMESRPNAGRIILWDGEPGTGKTFALRSLAYEWRSWADLHYIVDPDALFGQHSAYLMDLLLDTPSLAIDGLTISGQAKAEQRWRLIVLEDTGERLAIDAKQNVGQALSRLLNVTDGLIGQGSRVLFLVTTNEKVGRLHPAILRPGRCAGTTTFTALTGPEALQWLKTRGREHDGSARTIAELYGLLSGAVPMPLQRAVGFGR